MSNREAAYIPHTRFESDRLGVQVAQALMVQRGGPKIGEMVCHPSDKNIYCFMNGLDHMGIVFIPAESFGVKVVKKFPLGELYNPNDAITFSIQDQVRSKRIILLN